MKKRHLLLATLLLALVGLMASCSKESSHDVLNDAMQSFVKKDYKALADYLYLDTLEDLSKEEKEVFANIMTEQFKDAEFSSFKIEEFKDSTSKLAIGKVKEILKNGDSYEEELWLRLDKGGDWKISVLSLRLDTLLNDIDTTQATSPQTIKKDYKFEPNTCYALSKVLTNRENGSAMYVYGACLHDGDYCKKDSIESFNYMGKAASKNIPVAQFYLGEYYLYGYGIEANKDEAFRWTKKAADVGFVRAYSMLGNMYQNGVGVGKDINKAIEYFKKGAKANDVIAILMLGYDYENGIGVKKDDAKAMEYCLRGAKLGDATCQFNLGQTYRRKNMYKEAAKWYQKAADQNYPDALNNLGIMYENGQGVEKDRQKAYDLYKKAAEEGNVYAINNVRRLAPKN